MKKVLFYIVLLFGVLLIIVLYSPKYSPNLYNNDYNNSGYLITQGVDYQNINLGNVSLNKNIVLKPDGLIVSNSVDNNVFDYGLNNNVLTNNNPISNGGVVLSSSHSYNNNKQYNTNSDTKTPFNSTILPLSVGEKSVETNLLFSQELSSTKLMRNNGHGNGIEDNNGDDHGNGNGWGRDGNEGNGNGNGGGCNNVPLNDDLFVLLLFSFLFIVLKYLKIVK